MAQILKTVLSWSIQLLTHLLCSHIMRILIVTPHFFPETFKCNDMAFELQRRGHKVSVLTAIPDYPKGKFFDGYGLFKKRHEIIEGVEVHRSCIIPRGNGSAIRLALNYLSYTFFATLQSLYLGLTKKYDVVIVHETSPVMVGIPAVLIKKIQRIPLHFWVLDLWPESLTAAGGIKSKPIIGAFEKLTRWIYANSNTIMVSSKGFKRSICEKGDFGNKILYFPNWIDNLKTPAEAVPNLPEGFNIVFAGNIGDAQDFPHLLKAAELLKDDNINFTIIGDGRERPWVERTIKEKGLTNVRCIGRFPIETMPLFYRQADILFLALKDVPIFSLTVPAKLQSYMSSGKPVVAMMNGEGAELIKEADCGWSVNATDSEALAILLRKLSKEDPEILKKKGENGRIFSQQHFVFENCIDELERCISGE